MGRQTVIITDGRPGSGKTFRRCAYFLTEEFLPEETGVHCSNFPIFKPHRKPLCEGETYADRIVKYCDTKWKMNPEETRARIKQIPQEELDRWQVDVEDGGSGPWEWLAEQDITGWHIAIDEFHNYASKRHSTKHKQLWSAFVGEIRHRGATLECISQDQQLIATEVMSRAATLYTLIDGGQMRIPYLGVELADVLELAACYVWRQYVQVCFQCEHWRDNGKWVLERKPYAFMWKKYFEFYDSFDKPIQGGKEAANPPKRAWEQYGPWFLWAWFIRKNLIPVSLVVGVVGLFVWLAPLGGAEAIVSHYLQGISAMSERAGESLRRANAKAAGKPDEPEGPGRPVSPRPQGLEVNPVGVEVKPITSATIKNELPPLIDPAEKSGAVDVCGFVGEGVFVVGGWVVAVGEKLRDDGSKLESIDRARGRFVVDGRVHSLREMATLRVKADPVRGTLPSGVAPASAGPAGSPGGVVAPGRGDAAALPAPVAGSTGVGQHRLGSTVGQRESQPQRGASQSRRTAAAGSSPRR